MTILFLIESNTDYDEETDSGFTHHKATLRDFYSQSPAEVRSWLAQLPDDAAVSYDSGDHWEQSSGEFVARWTRPATDQEIATYRHQRQRAEILAERVEQQEYERLKAKYG